MKSTKVIAILLVSAIGISIYLFSSSSMGTTLGHLISLVWKSPQPETINVDQAIKEGSTLPNSTPPEQSPEEKVIAQYYLDYLGREADPSGLKHYVTLAKGGMTLDEIRQKIESSEEAANFRARKKAQQNTAPSSD